MRNTNWKYTHDVIAPSKDWLLNYAFDTEEETFDKAVSIAAEIHDWIMAQDLVDVFSCTIREVTKQVQEYSINKGITCKGLAYGVTPIWEIAIRFRADEDALMFRLTWM